MRAEKQTRDDLTNDQEPPAEYWQAKVERCRRLCVSF
jgi:hypothetical protein